MKNSKNAEVKKDLLNVENVRLLSSRVSELTVLINKLKVYDERKKKLQQELKDMLDLLKKEEVIVSVNRKDVGEDYCFVSEDEQQNEIFVKCKRIKSVKIDFNIDKLFEKLGKKKANKFVDTEVKINDVSGLKNLLKSHGVSFEEFKQFIDVERKVSLSKLDQCQQIGEIEKDDISGCYKVSIDRDYVKLSVVHDAAEGEK